MKALFWTGALCYLLASAFVSAKVEHTLHYTKSQTYRSALRHLRVDSGFKITEKDSESGYLLFEYPVRGSEKTTQGSIEVIERERSVAMIVQLPELPLYHERLLASGLLKKLRADYGDPPREKPPAKKEPPTDAEDPEKSKDEKKKFPSPKIQRAP